MKKLLFIALLLVFISSIVSIIYKGHRVVAAPLITKIKISRKLIDIGDRVVKTPALGNFTIYNIGTNDLVIQDVAPDCHCTVADFSRRAIKPNDSSQIVLKYDSNIIGMFQSSASVTTNSSTSPLILIFRGNIVDTSVQNK